MGYSPMGFSVHPDVPPAKISDTELIKDLRTLAYANNRFRSGDADTVKIAVAESETYDLDNLFPGQSRPDLSLSGTLPWMEGPSEIEVTYSYFARRTVSETGRPAINFELSVIGEQSNLTLPPFIAQQKCDMPPEEAVEEIGPVVFTKVLEYRIGTQNRSLQVAERFWYDDDFGETLFTGQVRPVDKDVFDVRYIHNSEPDEQDEDDEDAPEGMLFERDAIKQAVSYVTHQRAANEPIVFDDPDAAMEFWAALPQHDYSFDADNYDVDLSAACQVVASLREALRQYGGHGRRR